MLIAFIRALARHWVNWMSGLVGVLLWIGGFIADLQGWANWTRRSFWGGGVFALLISFYSVWRDEHIERLHLEKRVKGLPRLGLADHGFHADVFYTMFVTTGIAGRQPAGPAHNVLRLRVKNDPESSTPESVARGVRADVCFFSENGEKILEMDGRWSDTPQPHNQNVTLGVVPYLSVDFANGQARNLDVVTKLFEPEECYGVNNDSFQSFHLQNEHFRLPSGVIHCRVRMRGEYVDETFRLVFRSCNGPLQVLDAEQQKKPQGEIGG